MSESQGKCKESASAEEELTADGSCVIHDVICDSDGLYLFQEDNEIISECRQSYLKCLTGLYRNLAEPAEQAYLLASTETLNASSQTHTQ